MKCDVCVIGSGHAAIEAALVPARLGFNVLMVTMDATKIGQMSCNPAIGGIAKGQVVREIDALGGEMGKATDESGIQFKMLNRGKGPAVWSPRAQCDRALYRAVMTRVVKREKFISVLEGEVDSLSVQNGRVAGVSIKNGIKVEANAIILCSGTFMKGLLHTGMASRPGGRMGEKSSHQLSDVLRSLGFDVGRMKTGTPMRIDGRSVDFSKCRKDPGDKIPIPFSHFTKSVTRPQVPCWLTYTNSRTHDVIRQNLDRSPLYAGKIVSIGPRYCPSIEDKVVKFPHHERHLIFLEPEGLDTDEMYVNGLFTSLPEDVQESVVHSIQGLDKARIIKYGYAVEYDYCPPTQLWQTLETKNIEGLFFAGQINGTTGYEEAAGQGIIAGINAVAKLKNHSPLILRRDEAYIGVMIDDLVTKGVDEPYRLLTSRAEYRLLLRWDNADLRLMDYGFQIGLISQKNYHNFQEYKQKLSRVLGAEQLASERISKSDYPGNEFNNGSVNDSCWTEDQIQRQVEIGNKYMGYIRREIGDIERMRRMEACSLPSYFNYADIPGLSSESREKLKRVRPSTLGQAARIPGVTPSDISILSVWIRRLMKEESVLVTER